MSTAITVVRQQDFVMGNEMTTLSARNDTISFVHVAVGYEAVLYESRDYSGASVIVSGDNGCLSNLNDRASSIIVHPATTTGTGLPAVVSETQFNKMFPGLNGFHLRRSGCSHKNLSHLYRYRNLAAKNVITQAGASYRPAHNSINGGYGVGETIRTIKGSLECVILHKCKAVLMNTTDS